MQVKVRSCRLLSSFLCNSNIRLLLSELTLKKQKTSKSPVVKHAEKASFGGVGEMGHPQILMASSEQRDDRSAWMALTP